RWVSYGHPAVGAPLRPVLARALRRKRNRGRTGVRRHRVPMQCEELDPLRTMVVKSCRAPGESSQQPEPRYLPIALGRRQRNAGNRGDFIERESTKIAKFDEPCFVLIHAFQFI